MSSINEVILSSDDMEDILNGESQYIVNDVYTNVVITLSGITSDDLHQVIDEVSAIVPDVDISIRK